MISSYFAKLWNIVLPKRCLLCTGIINTGYVCTPCWLDLPHLTYACRQCAIPMVTDTSHCGLCLKNPPPYQHTLALFLYEPPIRNLIVGLKFKHKLIYAHFFGQLLASTINDSWRLTATLPDVILPVPLHLSRLRERGFNQALEIAKPISKALTIPLDKTGVVRHKPTLPQSGLTADQRQKNMEDAFMIKGYYQNLTIAIVDDVVTTGITIKTLASLLKRQGAKTIYIWSVTRRA